MTSAQRLTAIQTMADHSKKWHDGTSSRSISCISNTDGLAAIVSKLDNLGRDMKKLKENVHAIQVGCQLYKGAHLDKECSHKKEIKGIEKAKYGKYGRPFPNNNRNNGQFGYNLTPYRERRPSLSKVKTLTTEVEIKGEKLKDFKATFANDETPLYTPFYYSPEEIEYFSANFGFSNDEKVESTELKASDKVPEVKLDSPEQKINRPLLKEIRQTHNYSKYMKDLMANKPFTEEDDEVRMNPRCSALLQNQLPPKENDLGSFILPCSIRRMPIILGRPLLATAHAKVDIFRKSISLEVGNEKVIFKMKKYVKQRRKKILEDYWKERFGEEKEEKYEDNKANAILEAIHDKLDDHWFKGTEEDNDDLEGIIDYLEPNGYDGVINLEDEAYKERKWDIELARRRRFSRDLLLPSTFHMDRSNAQ
ncbi:hypothetical protein Tco_0400917 [Tanacetum coccineum]